MRKPSPLTLTQAAVEIGVHPSTLRRMRAADEWLLPALARRGPGSSLLFSAVAVRRLRRKRLRDLEAKAKAKAKAKTAEGSRRG